MNYSNEDILNLFSMYGECQKIINRTVRLFNLRYPLLPPMTTTKFRNIRSNFLTFGKTSRPRNVQKKVTNNEDVIIDVLGYFTVYPRSSIRQASRDIGRSYYAIQRILRDHKFHDYKFTPSPALRETDIPLRIQFCEWMITKIQDDQNFLSKIIWTDEAKFSRQGISFSRNSHHWSDTNPHLTWEMNRQENFNFNVFCLIKNDELRFEIYDENLNSEKYEEILNRTVNNFLEEIPLRDFFNCWYQLDGAPAHRTRAISEWLTRNFDDRWIRLRGPQTWPPRSMDLTPLDFFLWGRVKQIVYDRPVNSRIELEARVRDALNGLTKNELRRAISSVQGRVEKCLEANGERFEHL